jgi:predicted Zn-dependent protease
MMVLAALLLLTQAAAPAPPADPALAEKSRRGRALMESGRYGEAAALYRDLARVLPASAGLQLNLGMALHLSGQDAEAIAPLEEAARLDPASLPANLFLGAARLRVGRVEAAVAPLSKAVRLQPANREARSMLVDAYLGRQRFAEAEPHLRRLAQGTPDDPAVWFTLGKTYEELAARAVQDLVQRDPESPQAMALVAEARLGAGQRTAAFQLYRRALARGPALRGVHLALADIYRQAGHEEWAAVEEAKEKALPAPDCVRVPAECAFAAGRFREAVATAARPTTAAAYWTARAYGALAEEAFARLSRLPPSAQGHGWQAERLRDERRHAEAIEDWRKAIALSPDDPRLKVELAVTMRLADDLPGAQRVLEDLLRAAPDAPDVNYLLGDVLVARQQPEGAIPLLEKAVRLDPAQLPARAALGRALALTGNPAAAIPHLQKALPSDTDGSLRLQLARALQAAGHAEQARLALADYEQFRRRVQGEADPGAPAGLAPPE